MAHDFLSVIKVWVVSQTRSLKVSEHVDGMTFIKGETRVEILNTSTFLKTESLGFMSKNTSICLQFSDAAGHVLANNLQDGGGILNLVRNINEQNHYPDDYVFFKL